MRAGISTNAGAFARADASTDANIKACALAGINAGAYNSADVSPYANTNDPSYADTDAGAPVS